MQMVFQIAAASQVRSHLRNRAWLAVEEPDPPRAASLDPEQEDDRPLRVRRRSPLAAGWSHHLTKTTRRLSSHVLASNR